MSPACEAFIRAVLAQNWRDAFLNLNGLSMDEMLRGMAALDRLDLADLWAQQGGFGGLVAVPGAAFTYGLVDMPRIAYAYDVVLNRRLPRTAPGDLLQTGQVDVARDFIARPTPLVFEHDLTGALPAALPAPPSLAEADFAAAALALGVEVAAIMAVAQVEAGGRVGFAADGRPIIRYELHVFQGRTGGTYHATHPHLSQPTLHAGNPYHDGTQATEWSLMYGAMILRDGGNRRTSDAWQSASWGMFQVMGFNYSNVGWNSIDAFVADMFRSEGQHLNAFVGFVRNARIAGDIVAHDWAHFARIYNGPGYAVNHYDVNMAAAYARISARRQAQHLQP